MSVSRIFRRGFIYVTRAKRRATIFLVLYTILTFRLIFSISKIGAYYTYNLYNWRAVEISLETPIAIDSPEYHNIQSLISDLRPYADAIYLHAYLDYQHIRFVSYYTAEGSEKYAKRLFPEFKPSLLISGRYVENQDECLVMRGFSLASGGLTVTEPRGELKLTDLDISLKIVGVVSNETGTSMVKNAVLVQRDMLKRIAFTSGSEIYVFRIVILASGEGMPYLKSYVPHMKDIASKANQDLDQYGIEANIRYNENSDLSYKADVMTALIAFFTASIASRLYSVLLTRMRRDEIAMLKTFGRKNKELTILILAELLGETSLGFVLGVALVRKYVEFSTELSTLITAEVVVYAFLAVVALQLLGRLAIMFKSVGRIRPAEIARA